MDSQAALSQSTSSQLSQPGFGPASEVSQRSTPQLQGFQSQEHMDSPGPATNATHLHASKMDRAKYTSPAPPSSSMTPPPSSQILPVNRSAVRTPTPSISHLSSPPPTGKANQHLGPLGTSQVLFSQEQVNGASEDELRSMVNELLPALKDARTSAAHYKLQYNMLCMESSESSNRMAVELVMVQREVDVLQEAEDRRRSMIFHEASQNNANANLVNELSRHCRVLQGENENLVELLAQSRRIVETRDGEIANLVEENERLRGRIRKNREHMNGILQYAGDQSPPHSLMGTPQVTPRRRGHTLSGRPIQDSQSRGQQPFEALLLADKVLSQENATTSSTPSRPPHPKARPGHTRGSLSMSSMPSTPKRARGPLAAPSTVVPRTPPRFSAINEPPQSAPAAHFGAQKRSRRESSDSTITASSVEGDGASDDEIPESQASQAATSMLRSSQKSSRTTEPDPFRPPGGGVQTKLFGHIRKPGVSKPADMDKRKISGVHEHGSPTKKSRVMGLGIGLSPTD